MILLSTIALFVFAMMAAFDSFYFHIFQLKLYKYQDTRREHFFHTLRNFLLLFVVYFLFTNNNSGITLWLGVTAVVLDLIALFLDLLIETDGRKRFGGINKWEYLLHVMANGVYFASVTLILAAKEKQQWLFEVSEIQMSYPSYLQNISIWILIASALSLLVHIVLFFIQTSNHEK